MTEQIKIMARYIVIAEKQDQLSLIEGLINNLLLIHSQKTGTPTLKLWDLVNEEVRRIQL